MLAENVRISQHAAQCIVKRWGETGHVKDERRDSRPKKRKTIYSRGAASKVTSLRNGRKIPQTLDTGPEKMHLTLQLIHLLFTIHWSLGRNSLSGRKKPFLRKETERKGWGMPNDTRTGWKITGNRSDGATNPNVMFLVPVVSQISQVTHSCVSLSKL